MKNGEEKCIQGGDGGVAYKYEQQGGNWAVIKDYQKLIV